MERKLRPDLWTAVQNAYDSRHYTSAIIDAVLFLSNLIREKTGLEADGVALAGQALGGKSPKLKVNKLQTESDWNIQRGVEQLLRGIFQAIRNPRSHEKHTDSASDAEAIILFVNYLTGIIDQAESRFSKQAFLRRVFDPDFVENKRYAELLVAEVPKKLRLEILIDSFRQSEKGNPKKLSYVLNALIQMLDPEELVQLHQTVSDELKDTDSDNVIRVTLMAFSSEWNHLAELARIRIENKLNLSIQDGRYSVAHGRSTRGALGTWASRIVKHYTLRQELVDILIAKLGSADRSEQEYVFKFFFSALDLLVPEPQANPSLVRTIKAALKRGDSRFYQALSFAIQVDGWEAWKSVFSESIESFVEIVPEEEDDDLPF